MSILGLICVLLALVATLLFVLYMFQRRDLRAVSQLSLTMQRAISGERLPQRINMDANKDAQLDVQAIVAFRRVDSQRALDHRDLMRQLRVVDPCASPGHLGGR